MAPTIPHIALNLLLRLGPFDWALPVLNGHLFGARQRQFFRWGIASNDRTGADCGARRDLDRGHQRGIRADERIGSDPSTMLVDTIVVASNGAGSDIDAGVDIAITDITQMIHLAAIGHQGFFYLDKVTDMAASTDLRSGAQPRKGSDSCSSTDLGPLHDAVGKNLRACADLAVDQQAIRPNASLGANAHPTLADQIHVDQHVTLALETAAHIKPGRVHQSNAAAHQILRNAKLLVAFKLGKLNTVVDTSHFLDVFRLGGSDLDPVIGGKPDHVGKVILVLYIIVVDSFKPVLKLSAIGNDDPSI